MLTVGEASAVATEMKKAAKAEPARPCASTSGNRELPAKVLTVSDGVVAGTREDRSGEALAAALAEAGFDVVERRVVADGVRLGGRGLRDAADGFAGLVVTTGGTGFGPGTRRPRAPVAVLERRGPRPGRGHAPGEPARPAVPGRGRHRRRGDRAQHARARPQGRSSASRRSLDVVPHALALLAGEPTSH